MHNWAIAIMEHAGLLTREQAQKLSDEVKLRIHKEVYTEAFNEVGSILGDSHVLTELKGLKTNVAALEAELHAAKTPVAKPVVAKTKTL